MTEQRSTLEERLERAERKIEELDTFLSDEIERNAKLGEEVRTRRVVVVDDQGRERIDIATAASGAAWVIVRHPTIESAYASLIAGQDLEMDGAPLANVEASDDETTFALRMPSES